MICGPAASTGDDASGAVPSLVQWMRALAPATEQTIRAVAIDPAGNAGPVATLAYTIPAAGRGWRR